MHYRIARPPLREFACRGSTTLNRPHHHSHSFRRTSCKRNVLLCHAATSARPPIRRTVTVFHAQTLRTFAIGQPASSYSLRGRMRSGNHAHSVLFSANSRIAGGASNPSNRSGRHRDLFERFANQAPPSLISSSVVASRNQGSLLVYVLELEQIAFLRCERRLTRYDPFAHDDLISLSRTHSAALSSNTSALPTTAPSSPSTAAFAINPTRRLSTRYEATNPWPLRNARIAASLHTSSLLIASHCPSPRPLESAKPALIASVRLIASRVRSFRHAITSRNLPI